MTSSLPRQVLAEVKRALCQDMREPSDVKVRPHYQHLTRVNNKEITGLPPAFDATQKLSDEEMIDIILFGAPRTWQNEMDHQGFDPMEKTPGEVKRQQQQQWPLPEQDVESQVGRSQEGSY